MRQPYTPSGLTFSPQALHSAELAVEALACSDTMQNISFEQAKIPI